jgi:hypothetical protein
MNLLRNCLDEVSLLRLPSEYRGAIDDLREKFGHHIYVRERVSDERDYNCFAFALGIHQFPWFKELAHRHRPVVDSSMIGRMISEGMLELRPVVLDLYKDMVLYIGEDDAIKHAGRLSSDGGSIISKWCPGEIHEHHLWEVPASYGSQVQYSAIPTTDSVFEFLGRLYL